MTRSIIRRSIAASAAVWLVAVLLSNCGAR